jgi:hypothetical protein
MTTGDTPAPEILLNDTADEVAEAYGWLVTEARGHWLSESGIVGVGKAA